MPSRKHSLNLIICSRDCTHDNQSLAFYRQALEEQSEHLLCVAFVTENDQSITSYLLITPSTNGSAQAPLNSLTTPKITKESAQRPVPACHDSRPAATPSRHRVLPNGCLNNGVAGKLILILTRLISPYRYHIVLFIDRIVVWIGFSELFIWSPCVSGTTLVAGPTYRNFVVSPLHSP